MICNISNDCWLQKGRVIRIIWTYIRGNRQDWVNKTSYNLGLFAKSRLAQINGNIGSKIDR